MDAQKREEQLILGGGAEVVNQGMEGLPPEIQKDIAIITGGATPGEGKMDGLDELADTRDTALGRWQSMIKKGDKLDRITHLTDPHVEVFDLTNQEDRVRMEELYARMGNPQNGLTGKEEPIQYILDPTVPNGIRIIQLVKYWKPIVEVKPSGPTYEDTGHSVEQVAAARAEEQARNSG